MKNEVRNEEETFVFLKADEFMKKYPPNENLDEDSKKEKPCNSDSDSSMTKNVYRQD